MSDSFVVSYKENPFDGIFSQWTKVIGSNIARHGKIKIVASSSSIKRQVSNLVQRDWHDYVLSHSKRDQYIDFDLKEHPVKLSKYCLRSGPFPDDVNHLRSWTFSGSNDGENFHELDRVVQSQALNGFEKVYVSKDIECPEPYRYFRFMMTEKNWCKHYKLLLQKIELFGEVFGGSFEDKSALAKIYTEEDIQALKVIFNEVDTNGNGLLDPDELSVFFRDRFPLPLKMVPLAFRICDTDNSGSISFEEFMEFFCKLQTLRSNDPVPAYQMLFDAIDVDNKKALTASQIEEFSIIIQNDLTRKEAQELIDNYYNDCDGRLTFKELYQGFLNPALAKAGFTPRVYSALEINKIRAEFDAIDKDGSGELDREELEQFCGGQNGLGSNTADLVFLLCDYDKSGTISFDEYIEFCNMMVMLTSDQTEFFRKIFNALDADNKGALDHSQLMEFYRLVNFEMTPRQLTRFIRKNDTDKDGRLTYEEASNI